MKKLQLLITILLVSIVSCTKKNQDIVAIDVLLTVPEPVYNKAVELNHAILRNNSDNFTLDEQHIPHITLLQGYVLKKDLAIIEKNLMEKLISLEPLELQIDSLEYNADQSQSFASLGIEKNEALMQLHENIITILKSYLLSDAPQSAYVANEDGSPIDDFTIAYVPKFVSDHSYSNFNPHISLGVADSKLLDSMARNLRKQPFKPANISVYQLGNYGTARKKLFKVK